MACQRNFLLDLEKQGSGNQLWALDSTRQFRNLTEMALRRTIDLAEGQLQALVAS